MEVIIPGLNLVFPAIFVLRAAVHGARLLRRRIFELGILLASHQYVGAIARAKEGVCRKRGAWDMRDMGEAGLDRG